MTERIWCKRERHLIEIVGKIAIYVAWIVGIVTVIAAYYAPIAFIAGMIGGPSGPVSNMEMGLWLAVFMVYIIMPFLALMSMSNDEDGNAPEMGMALLLIMGMIPLHALCIVGGYVGITNSGGGVSITLLLAVIAIITVIVDVVIAVHYKCVTEKVAI